MIAESKLEIIARLRKEITSSSGLKAVLNSTDIDIKIGNLRNAFYNNTFPLGAVHEFICNSSEDAAVTDGFISTILSPLMQSKGAAVWIGSRTIFPTALKSFGIAPEKIIFIELHKEKEILWAMEEALKCEGLSAVIGEVPEFSFTVSRRLQLAVEESKVTGFILRRNPRNISANACVTRWKITAIPSEPGDMPGVGFPRWNVELLKVRNGKPGSWQIEFSEGRLRQVYKTVAITQVQQKKTG